MKILKYVINDVGQPIIFSLDNLHTDILTKFVAAGFVLIDYDYENEFFIVKCNGESSSICISNRIIYDKILKSYINDYLLNNNTQKNENINYLSNE